MARERIRPLRREKFEFARSTRQKRDEPAPDDHARGPGLYLRSYSRVWRASAHRGLARSRYMWVFLGFVTRRDRDLRVPRMTLDSCGEWALGPVPRPGLARDWLVRV
jgi:hypothetical protein